MIKILSAETSLGSVNIGSEDAPQAILQQSLLAGLDKNCFEYSLLAPCAARGKSEAKHGTSIANQKTLIQLNNEIYRSLVRTVLPEETALCLGGDHSVSIGSMAASKARKKDACVVYIDAHPDCNGPQDTTTGNVHGMGLATVLGDSLYGEFEFASYGYSEVFLIGIKDADPFELEYLEQHNVCFYTIDDIIRRGIADVLAEVRQKIGKRPVHVSLDIDSIDYSEAPATGIINKGGLTYREVSYLCRNLSQENILAIDCVEVNPHKKGATKTIALAADLVVSLLGGQWSEYQQYLNKA